MLIWFMALHCHDLCVVVVVSNVGIVFPMGLYCFGFKCFHLPLARLVS